MSGLLGFVGDRPQKVHLDQLRRAIQLLDYRGLQDQGIFLFDRSKPSQLHFGPIPEHVHFSDASYWPDDVATVMLVCPCVSKRNFSGTGDHGKTLAGRNVFVAFDGILDNEAELGQELGKLGRPMQEASQLEVLAAALNHWGPECLSRLIGTFAFVVLDLHRRSLILARDAFGTRPLFYARRDGWGLSFASNIGALLEIAAIAPRANRKSLYRYLTHNRMEHGAETFFEGIEQILPGHYLEVPLDKPTQSLLIRYRHTVAVRTKLTFDEAAAHLRELVTRSVTVQVGSSMSAGAAISGGYDSSFVVAAFKRGQLQARLKLYTCVPVVRNGTFRQSEEIWADLAAKGFQIPMDTVRVTADGLPESFAALIRLQEEPFSSPVVYAQLELFRAAQQDGVRVLLSGQGGDTLFSASTDQLLLAALAEARRGDLAHAAAILRAGRQLPQGSIRRLGRAATRMAMPESLRALIRSWRRPRRADWLRKKFFETDANVLQDEFHLPVLRFEDRNSMSCSMLNRMPLLTTELEDFVHSLPPEYLITRDQPLKSIENAAMRGMVPDAILGRSERSGFPVPVREWLVELRPWVERNMTEIEGFPFLEPRCVRRIWESVRSGNGSVSAAFLVWQWVFLAGWVRHCNVSVD